VAGLALVLDAYILVAGRALQAVGRPRRADPASAGPPLPAEAA
jgi:hypothetical protein